MKKSNGNLINFLPVVNGKVSWKNIDINLGSDFSRITLKQDGKEIYLDGNFFFDMFKLMSSISQKKKGVVFSGTDEFESLKNESN